MSVRKQSGCVVFKYDRNFNYQILLVKSSDGKDWVFPKGGVEKHLTSRESAAKEVWEEAGVDGNILSTLGIYKYRKQGRDQSVVMYGMQYTQDSATWPEAHLRKRKWFSIKEAETKVPKLLKPFLAELANSKMLALSATSVATQVADQLRELQVLIDSGAEIEADDDDTVNVTVKSGNDTLTLRVEDWGQHPQIHKLTVYYSYLHGEHEASHFKNTTLDAGVGVVRRIVGRFLAGDMQ